ncbi:MAG: sulfite exporter TauE/SafE family protein [Oleispira sp.]|nr:sulfite exporter TauE/SafE family protein [Oleispira sp.]
MLADLFDLLTQLSSDYSTEILLTLFATATSAIAGILGFGGGMLLIAIMPSFLPAAVIIPIHGIVQLASNSSRVALSLNHVAWHLLPPFLIGSAIGLGLFTTLLFNLTSDYIPLAIGSYILLNLWLKPFADTMKHFENFYLIGALQTGLSLIVGATGPLTQNILLKKLQDKDQIIATGAIFMSISHLAKIIVFGLIGFQFGEYFSTLVLMSFGAILGSYLGSKARKKVDNQVYIRMIKYLLSLLAIKMIIFVFI